LKNKNKKGDAPKDAAKAGATVKPFSKRTFCKEVHVLARKAGKKEALPILEAALKREKSRVDKKK